MWLQRAPEEIVNIDVPVKDDKSPHGYKFQPYPLIYPHDLISHLFNDVGISMSAEAVRQYWVHAKSTGEPWALDGPDDTSFIPVGFYGDGARLATVYKTEKLIGLWVNLPLWRPKSTRASRWMVFSILADKLFKDHTLNHVLKHLLWSFWCLYSGEIPSRGPFGGDLPKHMSGREGEQLIKERKLRFIVTEYRGDWEWHRDLWHVRNCSWVSINIGVCFKCGAMSKGAWNNAHYNTDENTVWAATEFSKEEFMELRQPDRWLCRLSVAKFP